MEPAESFIEGLLGTIASAFEIAGTLAMVVGFILAAVLAVNRLRRGQAAQAFTTLRVTLGSAILLGLEILVAADLVRTITSKPSVEDAIILGMIVIIRTILSMSISIEIEGVLPWKRALLESGGQKLVHQVKHERAATKTAQN